MNKIVNAIVVTYNRKNMLKECIEHLLSLNYFKLNIFIIDNYSDDNTYEYIREYLNNNNVYYYRTSYNMGGAGGFNYGLKKALLVDCDYLWLMDDDCIVNNNTLNELINFASLVKDNFGFLSSRVNWIDGSICNMNIQKKNITHKITNFECNQKVEFATFVSFFIKKSVVLDVGLPIKEFFIWGDDLEYSRRISLKYQCYYVANSIVTHKSKNNFGSNIVTDDSNLDRYYYAYRNEQYQYKKLGPFSRLYFLLKKTYHRLKIIKSRSNNKKEKLQIINRAVYDGKRFKPIIEYVHDYNTNINVLLFFCEPLLYGGQEFFMINMYKNFKNDNIHYTFATPFNYDNNELKCLINTRGDEVVYNNYDFHDKKRKKYIKMFAKKVIDSKYDTIHIQTGSLYAMLAVAKIAKRKGVKKIIVHSHCTGYENFKYKVIKKISDFYLDRYANVFLGCGVLACKWKYSDNIIKNNYYHVIKNGLDISKFKFNSNIRLEYRDKLELNNNFTILHVGRFEEQKNHSFIVDIAVKLKDYGFNFKMILIGEGPLKEDIITTLKQQNIYDKFIFLEHRNDINSIMTASDVFILPSFFEGLAITSIEAQATGLHTLCSNKITDECSITDLVSFLPLDIDTWVDKIVEISNTKEYDRVKFNDIVSEAGYNAISSSKELEDIYYGL